jgi:hypothetical protein
MNGNYYTINEYAHLKHIHPPLHPTEVIRLAKMALKVRNMEQPPCPLAHILFSEYILEKIIP